MYQYSAPASNETSHRNSNRDSVSPGLGYLFPYPPPLPAEVQKARRRKGSCFIETMTLGALSYRIQGWHEKVLAKGIRSPLAPG